MKKFTQTGGARVGGYLNVTWPFASIEITEEEISISVFGKLYKFEKGKQFTLARHRCFFSKGLLIETKDISDDVIFWSFNLNSLIDNLESRGYIIS